MLIKSLKVMEEESVIIMRRPVLMEDEGRHFFIEGPMPKSKAEKWIKAQKDEYFKPSDYYIISKDDCK